MTNWKLGLFFPNLRENPPLWNYIVCCPSLIFCDYCTFCAIRKPWNLRYLLNVHSNRSHYIQHQEKKKIKKIFWSSSIKYQLVILGLTYKPPGLPIDICGAMAQYIAIKKISSNGISSKSRWWFIIFKSVDLRKKKLKSATKLSYIITYAS